MHFTNPILTLAAVLANPAFGSPTAILHRDPNAEIIPGPGMPSLASLGLTTAELLNSTNTHASSLLARASLLSPRQTTCYTSGDMGVIRGIDGCAEYLARLGQQRCEAGSEPREYCRQREFGIDSIVTAHSSHSSPGGFASVPCRDAASVVFGVAQNCLSGCEAGNVVCYGAGEGPARANRDVIVVVTGSWRSSD